MDRCRATNNLFVGGFKNICLLSDVNLNNSRIINQDFCILKSILLFKTKNFDLKKRRSDLTNPDLIGI